MANHDSERDDSSFSSFLDDYYAECDEHLIAIRRLLLTLERSIGRAEVDRPVIDELFRHFHSLKGISAMVELRPAESLAHALEGYLRALRQHDVRLDMEGLDTMFDGTQILERVIVAHRSNDTPPTIEEFVRRLTTLAHAEVEAQAAAPEGPSAGAPAPALPVWRVLFSPSKELVARGVRVETMKQRLAAIGEILQALPKVSGAGAIQFEFLVATSADAGTFAAWAQDGVTAAPADDVTAEQAPVPEPEPVVAAPAASTALAPSHYVRVDLTRLDELMRNVGDLVISRARLMETLSRGHGTLSAGDWRDVHENNRVLERQLRTLREGIMRVRLVPIAEIFRRMPFVVRDLARDTGKAVRVELRGQATEIDKFLVERMMDPVLHLVRNAVSHAIEPPHERVAAGKPEIATITLAASTPGDAVRLEIADDGRGIDVATVAQRARALGLPVPAGASMDSTTLLSLISASGFSTRAESDRASGRGVGMAVVKAAVEELSGSLRLETEPGQGTRFIIELPVTLAITDALIAKLGTETFAVPQAAVREVIEIDASDIRQLEGGEVVPYRAAALPLARLGALFGMPASARPRLHAFVVGTGSSAIGFIVDRIVGQREIVVRSVADTLAKVEGVSGATDLGDGRVVLILDPAALGRQVRRWAEHPSRRVTFAAAEAQA